MNKTTPLADGRRALAPTASRRTLSLADLPVLALGALLATAILTGLTAVTPAGVALAGLSLLITAVVIGFARRQLRADPRATWFGRMAIALAIATVMMGLAGNVVLLVAAWIVSGRLMAGMIGHVGEWAEARAALRRASIAFGIGDLALVGAALLLSLGTGSTQIAAIVAAAPGLAPDIVLPAIDYFIHEVKLKVGNPYGFKATFNPTHPEQSRSPYGWVSRWHYGLNQGPIVLMIENYRSGKLWEWMKACPYIVSGLKRAGFAGGF